MAIKYSNQWQYRYSLKSRGMPELAEKFKSIDNVGAAQRDTMYNIAIELHNRGLSDQDIWSYFESQGMTVNSMGAYKESEKDATQDALNWFSQNYQQNEDGTFSKRTESQYSSEPLLNNLYNQLEADYGKYTDNMILSSDSPAAQKYKDDQYAAINEYEASLDRSLAASEMNAYQQIGQQQLELENMIANQRMQALKSGTTSAQLASQQLANIFAAQSGAQQIATNINQNRLQNYNTIAQERYGVTNNLYNMINANQQAMANVGAQLSAAKASGYAAIMSPYAQYNAYADIYNKNPTAINNMLGKQ